jgi:hypothetical protein
MMGTALEGQSFVVVAASTALTAERVLAIEATVLTLTDAGPNATLTLSVATNGITFAKFQQIATDRLLGRDTAATGNVEQLTVGGGLEFTGAGGIQRSALTGDVTAGAGSATTALANNSVTNAILRDSVAVSLIGRSANSTGDPADIAASADEQVLGRESGAVLFTAVTGANARVAVRKNSGATVGTRRRVNLIEGSAIALTVADDSGSEEVDVTIALTGAVPTYTLSNDVTDRTYDANATSLDELADVFGTLLRDLQVRGIVTVQPPS